MTAMASWNGFLLVTAILTMLDPSCCYRRKDSDPLYLDVSQPVSWHENKAPGSIIPLVIGDSEEDVDHRPQFDVAIADSADASIRAAFAIRGSTNSSWRLMALETFDHEKRRNYTIPIVIRDVASTPPRSATVGLYVHIEDVNEHPMASASTLHIIVYNYNNFIAGADVGHVYVLDGDHSDYFDKKYEWHPDTTPSPYFNVAEFGGFISAKSKIIPAGVHTLHFHVSDQLRQERANATVVVDVRDISEASIRNSGSLRISGILIEDLITPSLAFDDASSRRSALQRQLAAIFHVDQQLVHIFSIVNHRTEDGNFIDVRYYVTGLEAVRLDALATDHRRQLESLLGAVIVMNGIDPCLDELKSPCSAGCTNQMKISTVPYHSFSRSASFVGVKARVLAQCSCPYQAVIDPAAAAAGEGSASWAVPPGGLCTQDASGRCPFGFQAPRCDPTRHVPFSGGNIAWYNPLPACDPGQLTLKFESRSIDGILLYSGPRNDAGDARDVVSDYLAVELRRGRPVFYLNLGDHTTTLEFGNGSASLADDHVHQLEMKWNHSWVQMKVDECPTQSSQCWTSSPLSAGRHRLFNSKAPLQLGGVDVDLVRLQSSHHWTSVPTTSPFSGCIRSLTFNAHSYDLVAPVHVYDPSLSHLLTIDVVDEAGIGVSGLVGCVTSILLVGVFGVGVVCYLYASPSGRYKVLRTDLVRWNRPSGSHQFGSELNVIVAHDSKLMASEFLQKE